jgi:hypothetical protein
VFVRATISPEFELSAAELGFLDASLLSGERL